MPKEDERRKELTQKEIEAEKFRTFFSTSVAQVPEAMSRREEEETPPKRGLFGGLFQREKPEPETKEPAERGLELPRDMPARQSPPSRQSRRRSLLDHIPARVAHDCPPHLG